MNKQTSSGVGYRRFLFRGFHCGTIRIETCLTCTLHIVERGTIRFEQGRDIVVLQDFLTLRTCETIGMIETTRTNTTNEFMR